MMPDPQTPGQPGNSSPWRALQSALVVLPGLAGLLGFVFVTFLWIAQGFDFPGSDHQWMPIYIIPSAGLVLIASALFGLILRGSARETAPKTSLVLSIVSAIVAVLGFLMMLDCLSPGDMEDNGWMPFLIATALGLLIVSLPLFLHWRNRGQNRRSGED